MIRFQVMKGPNTHDEIVFYAFHFSLSESPSMCWLCRLDSNLEIRIEGSYGCLQLSFHMKNKYIDLTFLTGWWKASTTSAHKEGWHITGWYRSHVDKSICWCITSHPWTPSASTLYTSDQYTWFPSLSSYCCPSVAWEACGSWCKQSWWRKTGLCWSQPQDHLGLTI